MRLEAEAKAQKELEEQMVVFKIRIAEQQQYTDKRKYTNGKIESRSEYYSLLMRKRES